MSCKRPSEITGGNWAVGRWGSTVITNIPPQRPGYTWEEKEQEHSFYGGYLICESIMSTGDAALIAAAPELLHVLEMIVEANEDVPTLPYAIYLIAKKAVLKARPAVLPTSYYILPEIKKPLPLMLNGLSPNQHHSYYGK